ncbi:MAG: FAD/NAD(P)-binding protein [Chloroflexota bacterium]
MLDWLIIGGGIHGTHLAHVLVNKFGVPADALRILDPHEKLLAAWSKRTANTGMRFLRSPRVHHIDLEASSLERFAHEQQSDDADFWIDPYYRPSYDLFQQHCQHVIDSYQLDRLHIRGKALSLYHIKDGWCVDTASDRLTSKHVLLATGRQRLLIPAWAEPLIAENAPVQHVLDMAFDKQSIEQGSETIVIGGGISGGQIALELMYDHDVRLITRRPLRQHDFDTTPCWLGPACLTAFGKADYDRRRWMIGEARHSGTLAHDIHTNLQIAFEMEQVSYNQNTVSSAELTTDNRIALTFADGSASTVDHVILATGLQSVTPEQTWLADTIKRYQLPLADCGYPILNRKLCWADGLYASGSLAELELGPACMNIAGARATARRLENVCQI